MVHHKLDRFQSPYLRPKEMGASAEMFSGGNISSGCCHPLYVEQFSLGNRSTVGSHLRDAIYRPYAFPAVTSPSRPFARTSSLP